MAKKIKTIKRRRTCRSSGCKQILSIYNSEAYCHVHQQLANGNQISSLTFAGR